MEDDEIRAALRRGDDNGAFRLLMQAHGRAVYSACCRILRDDVSAEDMLQQAMTAAFNHRRKLLGVDSIRGWLIQIANRKCLDALRSAKRTGALHRDLANSDAPESSVLDRLASTEERRALEECLAALPPDIAAAVRMRYHDGMPWTQIAKAVGIPLDTIRMRVQRGGVDSLLDCLTAKGVAP